MTIVMSTLLVGCCTSRESMESETRGRVDSVSCVSSRVDTLIEKDSVWVTVESRADTVYRTEYRERVRWRVRELRDTVRVLLRDSVTKSVALEQSRMPREKVGVMATARGMLLSMLLGVVLFVIWRWRCGGWK